MDKEYINIYEIVIGEWDQLLIIGPYTERKEAENESMIRLNQGFQELLLKIIRGLFRVIRF